MIYGSDYSKFEVYTDSGLGTLTETILIGQNRGGFSGVTGESQNTPMKRRDLKYENPFTLTKTRVFTGYHYDAVLNIEAGDYKSPGAVSQAEDYAAEQATPRETDVHKAFRLVDYANAGYYILFTPHVDQAYVYGFTRYNVDLEIVGYTQGETIYADKCQLHVEGFSLLTGTNAASAPAQGQSARFAFAKALSFNGTTSVGTLTELDLGTTHTIEIWLSPTASSQVGFIGKGTGIGNSFLAIPGIANGGTAIKYQNDLGQNVQWSVVNFNNTRTHLVVTRNGTTAVSLYFNGVLSSAQALSGNNKFTFDTVGHNANVWMSGKMERIGCYAYAWSAAQALLAYNRGYGNWYQPASYGTQTAIWTNQGSGATETDVIGSKVITYSNVTSVTF